MKELTTLARTKRGAVNFTISDPTVAYRTLIPSRIMRKNVYAAVYHGDDDLRLCGKSTSMPPLAEASVMIFGGAVHSLLPIPIIW